MSLFGKTGPDVIEVARAAKIKHNVTEHLKQALKNLQRQYVNAESPIESEDAANAVCNIIEAIFLHGLKYSFSNKLSNILVGSGTGANPQANFWSFLMIFTHKEVVSQLNHLGQITTEIGMCRAWIRIAVNDGVLESYLDSMLQDQRALRKYYKRISYLRDPEHPGILKTLIQGLASFSFRLSYNSSVLNIWTTTPLILAGIVASDYTPPPVIRSKPASSSNQSNVTSTSRDTTEPVSSYRYKKHRVKTSKHGSHIKAKALSKRETALAETPPNKPYDFSQLTAGDIDEIRRMVSVKERSDDNSSTTSQASRPDPVDARQTFAMPPGVSGLRLHAHNNGGSTSYTDGGYESGSGYTAVQAKTNQVLPEHIECNNCDSKADVTEAGERLQQSSSGDNNNDLRELIVDYNICDSSSLISSDASSRDSPLRTNKVTFNANSTSNDEGATNLEQNPLSLPLTDNSENECNAQIKQESSNKMDTTSSQNVNAQEVNSPRTQTKSQPLEPAPSHAKATNVEIAQEIQPDDSISFHSESTSEQQTGNVDGEDLSMEGHAKAGSSLVRGNSLVVLQGWSSEFETSVPPDIGVEHEAEVSFLNESDRMKSLVSESFDRLLQNYGPTANRIETPRLSEVLRTLPAPDATTQVSADSNAISSLDEEMINEYEILPDAEQFKKTLIDDTESLREIIGQICNEKGLDFQNYQCKGCSRPVGIFYGKGRVCSYDSAYYCFECNENDEYYIPSRIVHNWDFRKHIVSRQNFNFLKQVEDDGLINIQECNPRLYDHVREMNDVKKLRTQLKYLKSYLFTCKQSLADDLRRQVWPKDYLYNDIHIYSLNDLLQVPSGQLAASLGKVIKFASKHVYSCRLCSQKGFVCEICDNPKVIYSFEMDTTVRCERCKAVYHAMCKTDLISCPKCMRRQQRKDTRWGNQSNEDSMDYSYISTDYLTNSKEC